MSLRYGLPLVFASVGTYFATTAFDDEISKEQGETTPLTGEVSPQTPSTEAPSYQAPSIEAPSYQAPSYQAPSYQAPSYQAPSYQAPSYQAPSSAPSYQAPSSAPSMYSSIFGTSTTATPSSQARAPAPAPSMFSSVFGTSTPGAPSTQTAAPAPSMFSSIFGIPAPTPAPAPAPATLPSTGPSISEFPAVPTGPPVISPTILPAMTETGPTGPAMTETGPTGLAMTETGPTGLAITETGPTGLAMTETGPTGLAMTEPGPTEPSGSVGSIPETTEFRSIAAWSDTECVDYLKQFNITDKSSFRRWLIRNHPDRGGDSQIFANVSDCVKRILPSISTPGATPQPVSTGLTLTEQQVPTDLAITGNEGVLEPITAPQANEVHKKQCDASSKSISGVSSIVQQDVDVLEPITAPQANEVHKKQCDKPLTPMLPPPSQTDIIAANVTVPNLTPMLPPPSQTDIIAANVTVPNLTPILPPVGSNISVGNASVPNLTPILPPVGSNISVGNASVPNLTPILPRRMGVLPSQPENSMRPLIHGEPQQGPVADTYDPSEVYRRTRAKLRRTGRGRHHVGNKTLKKRYIF